MIILYNVFLFFPPLESKKKHPIKIGCFFLYIKGDHVKEWLFHQIYDFNVVIFISIMIFNVALSKNNTQKMLQNQSKELYLEIEEVKDEIRQSENRQMKK
jgi:hypothetical protein